MWYNWRYFWLLPMLAALMSWGGSLAAQSLPKPNQPDLLAGRDWKSLTVVDPILDLARQQEVLALLERAERDYGLRFIVITVKAQDMAKYQAISLELMKQKLALDEGGVLVCSDDPDSQMMAYTKLLELRLGAPKLREIDQIALAQIKAAFGTDERAVTMVRVITEELGKAVGKSSPDGRRGAAEAFVFNPRLITAIDEPETSDSAPSQIGVESKSSVPASKHMKAFGAAGQAAKAPKVEKPVEASQTAKAAETSALPPARKLASDSVHLPFSILMAFLAVVLGLAAIAGWLIGSTMSKKDRQKTEIVRGISRIGPREVPAERALSPRVGSPPASAEPAAAAETVEDRGGFHTAHPIKPRQIESRPGRHGPATAPADMPPEWASLFAIADSNRRKSVDEYFDAQTEFDPHTLREIQLHYRVLFKLVPPASRPALTESLDRLLESLASTATKSPHSSAEHKSASY